MRAFLVIAQKNTNKQTNIQTNKQTANTQTDKHTNTSVLCSTASFQRMACMYDSEHVCTRKRKYKGSRTIGSRTVGSHIIGSHIICLGHTHTHTHKHMQTSTQTHKQTKYYTTSDRRCPGNGFENVMKGDHDVLETHEGRPRCFGNP